MLKHFAPPSRWNAIATALVAAMLAIAVAVSPATADHGNGKSRGRRADKVVHRDRDSQRGDRDSQRGGDRDRDPQRVVYRDRDPRVIGGGDRGGDRSRDYRGDYHGGYRGPDGSYRNRSYPRYYSDWRSNRTWRSRWDRHQPIWASAPTRVYYCDRRPYFYNSGFDVFFGGDGFFLQVGNIPPRGYYYYDPECGLSFATLSTYRVHLHHHHHPALIDVVVIDDPYVHPVYGYPVYAHDGCDDWWDD